ncbi:hypothetical protein V3C99_000763, partial [Haemonchus contortus]
QKRKSSSTFAKNTHTTYFQCRHVRNDDCVVRPTDEFW